MNKTALMYNKPRIVVFDNENQAFIPEIWAQESLIVLEANMVAAQLCYRDFEDEIAQFGDTVNTRQPGNFMAKRKTDSDPVIVQDAKSTNVAVKLDQHFHTSFLIKDGEESKGFTNLRDVYLVPALISIAQAVDEVILSQAYSFMAYSAGNLGAGMTKVAFSKAREILNTNLCPMGDRSFILTPSSEVSLLNVVEFTGADRIGDDGTALREGSLGRKYGFDCLMSQNIPSIAAGVMPTKTAKVNNGDGYAIGAKTILVDNVAGGTLYVGEWCTIEGDDTPQKIVVGTEFDSAISEIVITPGLKKAVKDNAVVTVYTHGTINHGGGYEAGYAKELTVSMPGVLPRGNLVSIDTPNAATNITTLYGAITGSNQTTLLPDRPIAANCADSDFVGVGPAGEYNFAFHKNAIALVSRPLAQPAAGTGALSFVANYNDLTIRVTITYNGSLQGHLVTIDLLCGVKVLNPKLGCLIYA